MTLDPFCYCPDTEKERDKDNEQCRQRFFREIDGREIKPRAVCRHLAEEVICVSAGSALSHHQNAEKIFGERPRNRIFAHLDVKVSDASHRFAELARRRGSVGKRSKSKFRVAYLFLNRIVECEKEIERIDDEEITDEKYNNDRAKIS